MSLKCPGCHSESMRTFELYGEQVDSCNQCEGIWFDNGELNGALSTADNGNDHVRIEESLGPHLGLSKRQCMHCEEQMHRYHLMDGYQIELDVCHSCSGVWVDKDERDKVVQSPRLQGYWPS